MPLIPSMKAAETPPANADLLLFLPKGAFVPHPLRQPEFDGAADRFATWRMEDRREYFAGLGDRSDLSDNVYRRAAAVSIRKAEANGTETLALDVSDLEDRTVEAVTEGFLLGAYRFDDYLTRKPETGMRRIVLVGPKKRLKAIRAAIAKGRIYAGAANLTRAIGNRPGNEIDPPSLAEAARALAAESGLRCRIWTRSGLEREGFGALLAVGDGSAKEPRLIRLDYLCEKKGAPTIAVVGKAITFDSGGLCLKQAGHMGEMKFDKMGGCAVLGILQAAAALQLPCNVVGLLAAAENMTGPAAFRPGDIVRTFDGTTVEVANTDAEGRLVLADALGYVRKKIAPAAVIDLATLTGACVVALGEERAGLFTDDEALAAGLMEAAGASGEPLWRLPLGREFDEAIRSEVADLRNLGATRWGGASTAAAFLAHWTRGIPHAHLDIAGPAMAGKEKPDRAPGATGYGVRLVARFLENWAAEGAR